jgi:hypothetical protein
MKVALCFIISYEHILNKENIWREWIEPNKDIINIYFYYKNLNKIKSKWIREHTIPPHLIHETSYYHVIPAYLSIINFAYKQDKSNKWFCMLTDSCCPIISPKKFRYLFYSLYNRSIISWKKAWWNVDFHRRANLNKLPEEYRLANDPWFILKRENVIQCLKFINVNVELTKLICDGGLANESLFAIILYTIKEINNKNSVINSTTHITDWTRKTTTTSPHLFKEGNDTDIKFIEKSLNNNKYSMFIRKISPDFPDEILKKYIYEYSKEEDAILQIKDPFWFQKMFKCLSGFLFCLIFMNFFYGIIKYI